LVCATSVIGMPLAVPLTASHHTRGQIAALHCFCASHREGPGIACDTRQALVVQSDGLGRNTASRLMTAGEANGEGIATKDRRHRLPVWWLNCLVVAAGMRSLFVNVVCSWWAHLHRTLSVPMANSLKRRFRRRTMPESKLFSGGFCSICACKSQWTRPTWLCRGTPGPCRHVRGCEKWLTLHLNEEQKKKKPGSPHSTGDETISIWGRAVFSSKIWRCAAHQRPSRTSTADEDATMTWESN
jgi:hypothetical protein